MWLDEDLPADIAARIEPICTLGNSLSNENPSLAIKKLREAFEILPEPREQWLAGTWILTVIGDIAYLSGNLDLAYESFYQIDLFEGWHDNPFIRLRRGQVSFDKGDFKNAENELAFAFMAGGYSILEHEDDKYAEFVLSKLLPPKLPVIHRLARYHLREQKQWWKFW